MAENGSNKRAATAAGIGFGAIRMASAFGINHVGGGGFANSVFGLAKSAVRSAPLPMKVASGVAMVGGMMVQQAINKGRK